jgi:hypothetical protein
LRRRSPPANGTRSHGGEHRRRRQGFRRPFLFFFPPVTFSVSLSSE